MLVFPLDRDNPHQNGCWLVTLGGTCGHDYESIHAAYHNLRRDTRAPSSDQDNIAEAFDVIETTFALSALPRNYSKYWDSALSIPRFASRLHVLQAEAVPRRGVLLGEYTSDLHKHMSR